MVSWFIILYKKSILKHYLYVISKLHKILLRNFAAQILQSCANIITKLRRYHNGAQFNLFCHWITNNIKTKFLCCSITFHDFRVFKLFSLVLLEFTNFGKKSPNWNFLPLIWNWKELLIVTFPFRLRFITFRRV